MTTSFKADAGVQFKVDVFQIHQGIEDIRAWNTKLENAK
jgi:hypothetical protein